MTDPEYDDDEEEAPAPRGAPTPYSNTVGSIVFWAIIRAAIVMLGLFLVYEYVRWIDYSMWWAIAAISFYAAVVHPITIQYRLYRDETRRVMSGTLCSSCKFFEETGVLYREAYETRAENFLPCGGELWEPGSCAAIRCLRA